MKVALVTGGSRGIGAETVKYFARNGYTVILNYHRSMQEANDLKRQMEQEGCGVHLYKANVADPVQVMAVGRACQQRRHFPFGNVPRRYHRRLRRRDEHQRKGHVLLRKARFAHHDKWRKHRQRFFHLGATRRIVRKRVQHEQICRCWADKVVGVGIATHGNFRQLHLPTHCGNGHVR